MDVRTPDEFSGGHPKGAVNVPFALIGPGGMMPNPEFLQVMAALFERDAGLVLGCASGGRSNRAAQMLAASGYGDLVNVEGGYSGSRDANGQLAVAGWCDCGLPIDQGADDGSYVSVRARARG